MDSMTSPITNRTKSSTMRQHSEKMKDVWIFSPVWQTVVPTHHYWFQMSVDALWLHWSQELVVSGLRKTNYICLAVIWVAAGTLMQEVFPTRTEGVASLVDHLCWSSCLLGDSGTKRRTRQWISWSCTAFQVDLLRERKNTKSIHKVSRQDDNSESFSGFPYFLQHFNLKQRKH